MSLNSTELHVKVQYLVYRWRCLVNAQGVTLDPHVTGVSIHIYGSASHGTETKMSIWKTRQRMACGSGPGTDIIGGAICDSRVSGVTVHALPFVRFNLASNSRSPDSDR
jgi:hypothetical protein